ncbi:B3 domain-containing protein REM5 [Abeliophyllum distichum]|uniref:B3 domain-containing protein REM5 n=1 Tax=Abeliophyllum distichum TaxID=126358 RepID=A0ABD1SGX8_9LAMI
MATNSKPKPSFFKVLIAKFTTQLRLPPLFMLKFGEKLHENVTLTINNGESWNVRLEQDGGHHYFTQGWVKFVKDLDLKMGSFLVFWLVGNSTIKVSAYGISGCEMEFPDGESQTDSDEPVEVPLRRSARNAKGKQPVYTVKKEAWTICDHKPESSAETTNPQPESSAETKNPRFNFVLKGYQGSRLSIGKAFATETGLVYKRAVVLEDTQGRYWPVALDKAKTTWFRLDMTTGWSEFRKENRLDYGDTCLLEFIPTKNVIRATVIKTKN